MKVSDSVTRIEHADVFGGLFPLLGLGLPYQKLKRNYALINHALKKKAEETG